MLRILIVFFFVNTCLISFGSEEIPTSRLQVYFLNMKAIQISFCKYFPVTLRCGGDGNDKTLQKYKTNRSDYYYDNLNKLLQIKKKIGEEFLIFRGRQPTPEEYTAYISDMMFLDRYSRSTNKYVVALTAEVSSHIQSIYTDANGGMFAREAIYLKRMSELEPLAGFVLGSVLLNKIDDVTETAKLFKFIRSSAPARMFTALVGVGAPTLLTATRRNQSFSEFGDRVFSAPPSPAHYIHFNYKGGGVRDEQIDMEIQKLIDKMSQDKNSFSVAARYSAMLAGDGIEVLFQSAGSSMKVLSKLKFLRVTPLSLAAGLLIEAAVYRGIEMFQDKTISKEMDLSFRQLAETVQKQRRRRLLDPDMVKKYERKLQDDTTRAIFALNVYEARHIGPMVLKLPLYSQLISNLESTQSIEDVDLYLQGVFKLKKDSLDASYVSGLKRKYCTDIRYGGAIVSPRSPYKLTSKWSKELQKTLKGLISFSEQLGGWLNNYPSLGASNTVGGEVLRNRLYLIDQDISQVEGLLQSLRPSRLALQLDAHRVSLFSKSDLSFNFAESNVNSDVYARLNCKNWTVQLNPSALNLGKSLNERHSTEKITD